MQKIEVMHVLILYCTALVIFHEWMDGWMDGWLDGVSTVHAHAHAHVLYIVHCTLYVTLRYVTLRYNTSSSSSYAD
jgi:hypothetical protein